MIAGTILLIFIYITSLFSIAGYGKIINIGLVEKKNNDLFELFFLGLPILLVLGITNYTVIGYSKYTNILFIFFGLFYYFYSHGLNLKIFKKIIFPIVLILGIFISKTHEDFHLYHFQHLKELTDGSIKFGMANLDGFVRYSYSSLFSYIQGFFYLPYFELKLFHVPIYLVYVSLCGFLFEVSKKNDNKKIRLVSASILIFLIIKFARLSEFGYDYISQFILIFLTFQFFIKNKKEISSLFTIILLFIFAVAVKITAIFFLPVIIYLLYKNKFLEKFSPKNTKQLKQIILILLISSTIIGNSFIKTGCIFYPMKFTCFTKEKISWAVDYNKIEEHKEIAEKWAKGFFHTGTGAFQKENPEEISEHIYAWVPFWLKNHFKNKILDFLIVLLLSFGLVFWHSKNKYFHKANEKKDGLGLVLASFLGLFFWFSILPQFRFGFSLIILLFTGLIYLFIGKIQKLDVKKINLIIIIAIMFFNLKNVTRIYDSINNRKDIHRYTNFPWFPTPKREYSSTAKFENSNDLFYKSSTDGIATCFNLPTPCAHRGNAIKIKKGQFIRTYMIISRIE